jgi:hypothetical protein
MATVWPASALMAERVPLAGEGISASTLSVEISNNGSSRSTLSPTCFSHLVMVPSVMDSPICGISTSVPPPASGAEAAGTEAVGSLVAGETIAAGVVESSAGFAAVSCGAAEEAEAAGAEVDAPAPSPITATTVLMPTVAPASVRISCRVPLAGEGISASTLSVEISKSGSSRSTLSPTFLSHLVSVPSVMDSPIWGIRTSVAIVFPSQTFLVLALEL